MTIAIVAKQSTVRAVVERQPDYEATSSLAMEAFASPHIVFDPDHLRWFYEQSFSLGTKIVALMHEGRKVGQIAMVRQKLRIDGVDHVAGQLCDLFIIKQHRSRANIALLYNEVERQFLAEGVRFGLGMPNEKAISVNEHFFKLKPHLRMQIRLGVSPLTPLRTASLTTPFDAYHRDAIEALLAPFATAPHENGLPWDAQSLFKRLLGRKFRYALHVAESGVLISSPRVSRSVGYTCLAAFFPHRRADKRRRRAPIDRRRLRLLAAAGVCLCRCEHWCCAPARPAPARTGPPFAHAAAIARFQPR
ncbi:MAG: GNAT family N-acetyltransferase [Phyllobacteriaceae bacterium]|nr:GNAT family N-acetyltransferase [Phyllobacteriaceae bacterium]